MGGGGGMLRAAGRAMTRTGVANGGIQDPFASSPASSSTTPAGNASVAHGDHNKLGSSSGSNNLTLSAASGSMLNLPVAATAGWSGGAFSFINSGAYEDFEWVSEEGTEEEDGSVFGSVPSVDEVHDAVSALQQ